MKNSPQGKKFLFCLSSSLPFRFSLFSLLSSLLLLLLLSPFLSVLFLFIYLSLFSYASLFSLRVNFYSDLSILLLFSSLLLLFSSLTSILWKKTSRSIHIILSSLLLMITLGPVVLFTYHLVRVP